MTGPVSLKSSKMEGRSLTGGERVKLEGGAGSSPLETDAASG